VSRVIVEAAVDSVASAEGAARVGADRLELCSRLDQDGLTPEPDLLRAIPRFSVPCFVMIRPRAGDFRYSAGETRRMVEAIEVAKSTGARGIVTGCLDGGGGIDREQLARLVEAAAGLPITFHRAFDQLTDPFAALDTLAALGVRRVLTSGGATTAYQGRDRLRRLVDAAAREIGVVAGGGITADHAVTLIRETGVAELHLSAVRPDLRGSVPNPSRLQGVLRALGR